MVSQHYKPLVYAEFVIITMGEQQSITLKLNLCDGSPMSTSSTITNNNNNYSNATHQL